MNDASRWSRNRSEKLVKAGADVVLEAGAGVASYFSDDDYQGAERRSNPTWSSFCRPRTSSPKVQPPVHHPVAGRHEVDLFREGAAFLTTLYPTRNLDAVRRLAARRITSFAADCIPRTTRAQTMDVLSSMANIAGYKGVILAADQLAKYFPMFMTAAGTVFSGQGVRHRGGGRGVAGDRHRQAPRRDGDGHRHPTGRQGTGGKRRREVRWGRCIGECSRRGRIREGTLQGFL